MFLSLPVPSKDRRMIEVILFYHSNVPVKYGVRVSKAGLMYDLKVCFTNIGTSFFFQEHVKLTRILIFLVQAALAALSGLPIENILMADIYSSRAFVQEDGKPLYDVRSNDVVYAYVPSPCLAFPPQKNIQNQPRPLIVMRSSHLESGC